MAKKRGAKGKPLTNSPSKRLPDRQPRTTWSPVEGEARRPRFSFEFLDRAYRGEWGWESCDSDHVCAIFAMMRDLGQNTWAEIRRMQAGDKKRRWLKYHSQSFADVSSDAQKRVTELGHDERFDELARFRLNQKQRLWGFERDGVFYLLWWDPEHKVYPTSPH